MAATEASPPARPSPRFPWLLVLPLLLVFACEEKPEEEEKAEAMPPGVALTDGARLAPAAFETLPGWSGDRQGEALSALRRSCGRLATLPPERPLGPDALSMTAEDWREPCSNLPDETGDSAAARAFFEAAFRPFAVLGAEGKAEGLFTGYYEAAVNGSLEPRPSYNVPLYRPPDDRVEVELQAFDPELPKKTLIGRLEENRLLPYWSRKEIDGGRLAEKGLELLWLDDPVDAFFLSVQGSGVVRLPDGREIRVGYAGSNGRGFYAIGRALIESGAVPREAMSMQAIRDWLRANPEEARALMQRNDRYIFFRLIEGEGPIGAQGVALTPKRSLAVDPEFIPLGAPVWLEVALPEEAEAKGRLMVAQDTGSAIKGAVRGDFFFGSGEPALAQAGRMKAEGRYWLLLPKSVADRLPAVGS